MLKKPRVIPTENEWKYINYTKSSIFIPDAATFD